MLTKEESLTFIRDVLDISDAPSKMAANKLEFLNLLVFRLQHTVPFQNISLMAEEPSQRHRPTTDEMKESLFSKKGGLCYTQNVFAFYFLNSLGYDAYLNSATVTTPAMLPDNHVIVLVKNVVKPGDLYLVEISIGHPTFEAICMDFEKESPLIKESFLEYKYVKEDGKILRMHGEGDFRSAKSLPYEYYIGNFRRFYDFELNLTTDLGEFDAGFDSVFTDPDITPFHDCIRAITFKDEMAVMLVNSKLMLEGDDCEFTVRQFDDDDELVEAYNKYFPQLSIGVVEKAVRNWRTACSLRQRASGANK
ncbi:uncharacterized protein LOC124278842 [Haliotis rubra]|uniref:uncharacterized protein LOC124278842 n=1 Tax=Haliotis rubra TaxID=36100 RepID=UPI001EE5BA13|nr:uncharacterized protein LOC124278842 [Haliotis rubra]XP_046570574.1 uncharacterized protein LOC124278842 [Haliotis rubra]XP_046570575.1 uncharacterized protein LOC124278842 [Haliotis rubra]